MRKILREVIKVDSLSTTPNNGIYISPPGSVEKYYIMDKDLHKTLLKELKDHYGIDTTSVQSGELAIQEVRRAYEERTSIEVWHVELAGMSGLPFVEIYETRLPGVLEEDIPAYAKFILSSQMVSPAAKRELWRFMEERLRHPPSPAESDTFNKLYFYEDHLLGVGNEHCSAEDLGLPPDTPGGKILRYALYDDIERACPVSQAAFEV